MTARRRTRTDRLHRMLRVTWAVLSGFVVESIIFGLSVLPGALFWTWHFNWTFGNAYVRIVVLSMAFMPAYLLFCIALMVLSALAMRLMGWRTPDAAEMRIDDLDWPLLRWVRYTVSIHLVRLFAGTVLRATPLWSWYHRLNGAKVGRDVWINTISLMDHNLLEFGDHVVIGSDAHASGHLVEGGVVKTARIHFGNYVTVGLKSVIGIGVTIGDQTQVGALSVVPKHRALEPRSVYGGVPAHKIERVEPESPLGAGGIHPGGGGPR
ncbi:hypothetical protein [Engelhardtia mirabilis]